MVNYKDYNLLGDGNITAALYWAQDLGQNISIPSSLQNSTSRASFINDFNNTFGQRIGTEYISQEIEKKNSFLKEIADYCKKELNGFVGTDEEISGLILALWASCILVCKYIDPRRKDISKEVRRTSFADIFDQFANDDPVFRIGMETCISFCELRKEDYILDGVPDSSFVRK